MITLDGRTISIHKGNSGSIIFGMYLKDHTKFALDGCTVTFMVKRSKRDPDSKAVIVVGPTMFDKGISTSSDLKNSVSVFLTKEATNITPGFYHWALQIKKDSYVNEAVSGQFYIVDGVIDE